MKCDNCVCKTCIKGDYKNDNEINFQNKATCHACTFTCPKQEEPITNCINHVK